MRDAIQIFFCNYRIQNSAVLHMQNAIAKRRVNLLQSLSTDTLCRVYGNIYCSLLCLISPDSWILSGRLEPDISRNGLYGYQTIDTRRRWKFLTNLLGIKYKQARIQDFSREWHKIGVFKVIFMYFKRVFRLF